MKLDELLTTVTRSYANEWHDIEHQVHYGWEYGEKNIAGGMYPYLEPNQHSNVAILKDDVDISLAFGAVINADFVEPWTQKFPDEKGTSIAVELRYRGQVVYDWVFVFVDGGRFLMPIPKRDGKEFSITKDEFTFASLMFDIVELRQGATHTLDGALQRAGIKVV